MLDRQTTMSGINPTHTKKLVFECCGAKFYKGEKCKCNETEHEPETEIETKVIGPVYSKEWLWSIPTPSTELLICLPTIGHPFILKYTVCDNSTITRIIGGDYYKMLPTWHNYNSNVRYTYRNDCKRWAAVGEIWDEWNKWNNEDITILILQDGFRRFYTPNQAIEIPSKENICPHIIGNICITMKKNIYEKYKFSQLPIMSEEEFELEESDSEPDFD